MKKIFVVLLGGISGERKVSFLSGKSCSKALKKKGYKIKEMEAQPTNRQTTSVEYVNNPEFIGDGGYKVTDVKQPVYKQASLFKNF